MKLIEKRRLSTEQYVYCARDPVLPLFFLHFYAFQHKGSYVQFEDLKAYFARHIILEFELKKDRFKKPHSFLYKQPLADSQSHEQGDIKEGMLRILQNAVSVIR